MRIKGLNHFNVVVNDLESAAQFYEKLGLVRGERPDFGNTGIWLFIDGVPRVHLNPESEEGYTEGNGPVRHLGFDVTGSVEDACRRLRTLGIDYKFFPKDVPGWYKAIYFDGPGGETIELVMLDHLFPARRKEVQCAVEAIKSASEKGMRPSEALAMLKTLRESINDCDDPTDWQNETLDLIDKATDSIEFPKNTERKEALQEAEVYAP